MTPIISFFLVLRSLPQARAGVLSAAAMLIAGIAGLTGAATAYAQEYDAPIATPVKNMDQPSGPNIRSGLSKYQDGVMQGFRTGPVTGGYELESILLPASRGCQTAPARVALTRLGAVPGSAKGEVRLGADCRAGQSRKSSVRRLVESMMLMSLAAACRMER